MVSVKAWKSKGKCEVCWQIISEKTQVNRPAKWFQGALYHEDCWHDRYKKDKRAQTKKAQTKRSF